MHSASLKIFETIAKTGSLRRASEELHIAPSALSRRIRLVEAEYETSFFDRKPTGLSLTAEGQLMLRHIRNTLDEHASLCETLKRCRNTGADCLRIAALDSLSTRYLPKCVVEYRRKFPDVNLDIVFARPARIAELLDSCLVDIGISLDPSGIPNCALTIAQASLPIVALVGSGHQLAHRKSVSITECLAYDILLHCDWATEWEFMEIELSGVTASNGSVVRSNSAELMQQLIMSGRAIGFYTPICAIDKIREGRIVPVRIKGSRLSTLKLSLIVNRNTKESRESRDMISRLRPLVDQIYSDCNMVLN